MSALRLLLLTPICLAQSNTAAASTSSEAGETSTTATKAHGRDWEDLIDRRRKLPPYDRYRHVLVPEWDPMIGPPVIPKFPTHRPTLFPTPSAPFTLPPTMAPVTDVPTSKPTRHPTQTSAPTSRPTTVLERGCPIDGYWSMHTITLKDKWGDGWDGSFITVRDRATGEPIYSGTMIQGKERTDYICLKAWSCYEVIVTGGQWSDEISWSVDRMEDDVFDWGSSGNSKNDGKLAYGGGNYYCTFAITDTDLMYQCSNSCDGTVKYPTVDPTIAPTTLAPTPTPTAEPTISDDGGNFNVPRQPTIWTPPIQQTQSPTLSPTVETLDTSFYPMRPEGYYSYDVLDGYYGPMNWRNLFPEGCGTAMQSPIHLGPNTNVACAATHEIRSRAAEFSICDPEAGMFSVTPTRLRLDFTGKKQNPETDLPDGFGVMEAQYLEVAYPSLHTTEINGRKKRYDAEYTIVHDFVKRDKATLISILIDASGSRNARFQDLLDEWSKVSTCRTPQTEHLFQQEEERIRRRRNLQTRANNETYSMRAHRTAMMDTTASSSERNLACAFNIYHRTLMPSTYYYAYQGSMPEPPCVYGSYLPGTSEWRVINKPMIISPDQLGQLKALIEDGPCRGDPYAEGLGSWRARPTQPSEGRMYWQCHREDFPLDCERNFGYCDCNAILCPEDFDL